MNELKERLEIEIAQHGTMWATADYWSINPGTLWRIQKGGDSPQVRRKWEIPKGDRVRFIIEMPKGDEGRETIARYDAIAQSRGMTRGELLMELLRGYAAKESK